MQTAIRFWTTFAILVVCGAANAADIRPILKAPPPPPVAPIYNWTGFYVGGHGGASWAHNTFSNVVAGEDTAKFTADGYFGGGQIGHNWQTGSWVLGVELEGSLSHLQKGVFGCGFGGFGGFGGFQGIGCGGGGFGGGVGNCGFQGTACGGFGGNCGFQSGFGCGQFGARVHKLGLLSGRIGYAWDRWLVFAKGGGAVAEEKVVFNLPGLFAATPTDARFGWTVGAGIELGLAANWSVKVEYNYIDLGTERFTFTAPGALTFAFDHNQQVHLMKFGINYRFASAGRKY